MEAIVEIFDTLQENERKPVKEKIDILAQHNLKSIEEIKSVRVEQMAVFDQVEREVEERQR